MGWTFWGAEFGRQEFIILGFSIAIALLIGYYFHFLQIKRRLEIYVVHSTRLSDAIPPEVRDAFQLRFEAHETDEYQFVEYVVRNRGPRAVTPLHKPLTLPLPDGVQALRVHVRKVHPSGRDVTGWPSEGDPPAARAELRFGVLNRGEFVRAIVMVKGRFKPLETAWRITAAELPAEVPAHPFVSEQETTTYSRKGTEGAVALVAAMLLTIFPTVRSGEPIGSPFIDESPLLAALSLMLATAALVGAAMYLLLLGLNRLGEATDQRFREKAIGTDEDVENKATNPSETGHEEERQNGQA